MPNNDDIYFVLNGLVNGEEGSRAVPAGSGNDPVQKDGWYFLLDGNADGQGPFNSREAAERELKEYVRDHYMSELRSYVEAEFENFLDKITNRATELRLVKGDAKEAFEFLRDDVIKDHFA